MTTASAPQPAETNLADVPLYTPMDVSRYLRLPVWSVLQMTGQWRGDPEEWLYHHSHRRGAYLIGTDDLFHHPSAKEKAASISFRRLADLFVIASAIDFLVDDARSGVQSDDVSLEWVHKFSRGFQGIRHHRVFIDGESEELRLDRTADQFGSLTKEDSAHLRKWLSIRIGRVESIDGMPVRLYPFTRDPAEGSPRIVVLDPHIRFGRPTLSGRGLPTDILFERHQAGDSASDLAEDYGVTMPEIEESLRYEGARSSPFLSFWGW